MSGGPRIAALAALLLLVGAAPALADDDAAQAEIRATLARWTAEFNARDTGKVCDIFETDVLADIRTEPEQNYEIVCDRLKRSLTDPARSYSYSSDIKEILVFGDVAVVRLVWTLTIAGGAEGEVKSIETGMDLFRRQADGGWKIMRWMAYN
jgi:ketosteroid isomerase-like protein